jgi:hypothetical protein
MFHMTREMHAQAHWRPDAITRTGVIEPMWIRQVSPVDMARHTIDPFIASVRGAGPAVSPYPSPEDVAYAAGKLAQLFARGKTGTVCMGTSKITVGPNTPPGGGIVGTITQAAQELARGGTVTIQIGARRVIVCNSGPGGEPQVAPAGGAPAASIPVRAEQQTKPAQFGAPMMATTVLPKQNRAGHVPAFPYFDYAQAYRNLNYNDNVWARRNFQAKLAGKFAPHPVMQMHAANNVPINYAHAQARPPLMTRAPMVQGRWPHPQAVWPGNTSVNVRKEQR